MINPRFSIGSQERLAPMSFLWCGRSHREFRFRLDTTLGHRVSTHLGNLVGLSKLGIVRFRLRQQEVFRASRIR